MEWERGEKIEIFPSQSVSPVITGNHNDNGVMVLLVIRKDHPSSSSPPAQHLSPSTSAFSIPYRGLIRGIASRGFGCLEGGLPSTERTYYCHPYAIKNQQKAINSTRLPAEQHYDHDQPIRVKYRCISSNENGEDCCGCWCW